MFLYCCTAVETVALSLRLSYSRLFLGIYNRPGKRNSERSFQKGESEGEKRGGRGGGKGTGGSTLFPHARLHRLHVQPL